MRTCNAHLEIGVRMSIVSNTSSEPSFSVRPILYQPKGVDGMPTEHLQQILMGGSAS